MTLVVMVVQPVTVVPVTVVLQRSLVLAACHAFGIFVAAACPVVPVAVVLLPVPVVLQRSLLLVSLSSFGANLCFLSFLAAWSCAVWFFLGFTRVHFCKSALNMILLPLKSVLTRGWLS